jgi:hypothetical protein
LKTLNKLTDALHNIVVLLLYSFVLTKLNGTESRVFLEKLIVTQLVKKFPAFCGILKVHYGVHKNPLLIPALKFNYIIKLY